MDNHFEAIVIGSGIGGMSCASALAHFNKKVLVLEQHYVAGGMTHTFKRKDFIWDVGVHALGEMTDNRLPKKLFNWLSDNKLNMLPYGHPYETFIFNDGFKFEYPNSKDEFQKKLIETFPSEEDSIIKYLKLINIVGKLAKNHFAARLMPMWLEKLSSPILKRKLNPWINKTVKDVLDDLFKDQKLKAVLSGQWGYYGASPSEASFFIHALTTRHFWEGAYYPEGTSKTIAETFLASVIREGGEVKLKTQVEELILDGKTIKGVKTNKGDFYAPIVVSAANALATVNRLVPKEFQKDSWVKNINKLEQTPCHICLYLGFEGDIKELGATESNQWWCDSYDFEKTYWHINDQDELPPIIYTSFPSLKDPSHQLTNKDGIPLHTGEVVTFVPFEYFEKWKDTKVGRRGNDYKEFKKNIEERLLKHLKTKLPKLMEKCVYHELSTPLSTTHFCQAPKGAIYGLKPTPKRWNTLELRPKTPIKGLYMSGSDIGTLGVVGAMIGGIVTASKIDRRVASKLLGS